MEIKTCEIDGKRIAYTSETEFLVQTGRGKGYYSTVFKFKGEPIRAARHYMALNVGKGYKKRLLMPSCTKNPVIARQITF